jgi:hypothetical protein
MKKRGNEMGQVSREEFEAQDDTEESDVQGIFARASTEQLAARKIIKVKKRGGEGIRDDNVNTTPVIPTPSNVNPFASFGNALTQPALAAPSNPFGGFSGLVIPPVTTTTNSFSNQSNIQPAQVNLKQNSSSFSFDSNKPPQAAFNASSFKTGFDVAPLQKETSTVNGSSTESNYKKKITKLNSSILSWMDRQIVEHPISIWKDGLKDYVRYATEISDRYSDEKIPYQNNDLVLDTAPTVPLIAPSKAPTSFSGFTLPNSTSSFTGFSLPTNGTSAVPASTGDTGFNLGKKLTSISTLPAEIDKCIKYINMDTYTSVWINHS